jgi:hypothetical protein
MRCTTSTGIFTSNSTTTTFASSSDHSFKDHELPNPVLQHSSPTISAMDAFTISTGVAGFLSLALEISKILKAYIGGVKSAPEEARNLLVEVTALCHALEQLIQFLRKDYNGNFAETSALVVATDACKEQISNV